MAAGRSRGVRLPVLLYRIAARLRSECRTITEPPFFPPPSITVPCFAGEVWVTVGLEVVLRLVLALVSQEV